MQQGNSFFENFFKLKEKGTSIRTEVVAGITTFITMAYVLAVNPQILSAAGMDPHSVLCATAIGAAIGSILMGLWTNLPIALAPGMGLNAFFAFTVVLGMGYSWQFALTAVFLEGIIFILLTLTNLREAIVNCIPLSLKTAIAVGIGLFIAFVGLQSTGIIVANSATLVALGDLSTPQVYLSLIGIIITGALLAYKVRGALLLSIFIITIIGIPFGITNLSALSFDSLFVMPTLAPTFMQFEWHNIFTIDMLLILFVFLFNDLFDTIGTLLAVVTKANLLDKDGNVPNIRNALLTDAVSTTVGAVLGTSTVTAYVESTSGVSAGGRTGLTAVTVGILFVFAILLTPFFLIVPIQATGPILIIVGLFMLEPVVKINFQDYVESVPAFLIILITPLAYSIGNGLLFGMTSFVVLAIISRRTKDINIVSVLLAVVFFVKILSEHFAG